jgi:hypothetical protein
MVEETQTARKAQAAFSRFWRPTMNRRALIVTLVVAALITLSAVWWYQADESRLGLTSKGSAFDSFLIPQHMDVAAFEGRLASTGFVADTSADFNASLPEKYRSREFSGLRAYRHTSNSASQTRILGFNPATRRVHYLRVESVPYQSERPSVVDTAPAHDPIHEALLK